MTYMSNPTQRLAIALSLQRVYCVPAGRCVGLPFPSAQCGADRTPARNYAVARGRKNLPLTGGAPAPISTCPAGIKMSRAIGMVSYSFLFRGQGVTPWPRLLGVAMPEKSQSRRIFELLWINEWVPTYRFPNELHILQYNSRIHDLRSKGCDIQAHQINGVDGYRLVNKHCLDFYTMAPKAVAQGQLL